MEPEEPVNIAYGLYVYLYLRPFSQIRIIINIVACFWKESFVGVF